MPYSVYIDTKYATTSKQLDERRDGAAAAGARAQTAVPTAAVGQSRGPAAGLAKPGDARRGDFARWRGAVEAALAADMLAMKRCLERVLPRRRERPVRFSLPSLAAICCRS
jgi:hypothetical protein